MILIRRPYGTSAQTRSRYPTAHVFRLDAYDSSSFVQISVTALQCRMQTKRPILLGPLAGSWKVSEQSRHGFDIAILRLNLLSLPSPNLDISLFHTTIRFGMTREVATVSNGSLARSRIINANRSDKAQLNVNMKFGVDVPLSKVLQFKSAVQQYVHDRPREFASRSIGFRLTRVETDLGFVEYRVVVQSQHSWQKVTAVLECKAKVASFCLEVQKKLDMRFVSPPMPVNLRVDETDEVAELAKRKHDAAVKRRSSQSATKEEQTQKERHHRSMPSMGEKISVIAELFGDTKKSR